MTSAEDGEGIVKTALDKFGGAHVLVANAGVARPSAFEKMSEKDWDEVLAVHLRSVLCIISHLPVLTVPSQGYLQGSFLTIQEMNHETNVRVPVRQGFVADLPEAEVRPHRDYGLSVWSL